ncbi:MAG: metallophosphoesterase [Lachnospiraceae bacterium]|nr:metallophosphoesterase [Lachnospiraceae bacterium]
MSTYVVSDIHGQFKAFLRGLDVIEFNDNDSLYVIGDAIDRGSDGIPLLEYIRNHPNTDLLIGNHEFMMLNSVDPDGEKSCPGKDASLWLLYNSGHTTIEQYLNLSQGERIALLQWLRERCVIKTLVVGERKFCLTHSYYYPECENIPYYKLDYEDVWHLTWDSIFRDDKDTHAENIYKNYDCTFITGHVPAQVVRYERSKDHNYGELRSLRDGNLIDIDGYCALGYHRLIPSGLIFLRLDDLTEFAIPLIEGEISE